MSARRLAHGNNPLSFLEIALITIVLGVAAAVAVPEYLQLRQDANDDSAKTRLTQASRAVEQHRAAAGSFVGASLPAGVRLHTARGTYCLETSAGSHVWHATRGGKPSSGAC